MFADTYALHPEGQALVERLRNIDPDFVHLRGARIVVVGSQKQPMLRGSPCQAFICQPKSRGGPLRDVHDFLFERFVASVLGSDEPEWCIVLDAALWESFDAKEKQHLISHELQHLRCKEDPETGERRLHEDGRPQLRTVPHDYEAFGKEIREHAAEIASLPALAQDIAEGLRRANGRARKRA
jgi:hypothetical protein